ncbi:hypothetical protein BASA81_002003 [Batrachochytrium salamandrivorans]|nr:hypothetical protein BASA81_002003 [Batrachochytrium salamandrivorans]
MATTPAAAAAVGSNNKRVITVEDVQQRYKFWRKYVSTLYDLVSTHTLNAPVPCVEIIDTSKGDWSQLVNTGGDEDDDLWSSVHSRLLAVGTAGYDTQSSIEFFQTDIPAPNSTAAARTESASEPLNKCSRVKTTPLFSAAAGANSPEEELLVFRPHPDRSTLLASTNQKGLSVWDFEGRSTDFKCVELSKAYGQAIAWQQNRLLLGAHNGAVFVFDVAAEQQISSNVSFTELSSAPHSNSSVFAVECSSSSEFLSASGDGSICLWDIRQSSGGGSPNGAHNGNAHDGYGVSCLSTLRESLFLSGAGLDAMGKGPTNPQVKLWDLRNLQTEVSTFTCNSSSRVHTEDHGCAVHQVRWNPHASNEFASCSEDGAVRLWDKSKIGSTPDADGPGELLFVHAGHVGAVTDFQFDPKFNRTLVSASDENVMIWRPLLSCF